MIVASTFNPPGKDEFQGYCFLDEDLIVGQQGAEAYFEDHGIRPLPGEDGCYLTVTSGPDGWRFGTDSRGLSKWFIYRRGTIWAISSSLYGLVQHLRDNGVYPTPNLNLAQVYGLSGTFVQQPGTLEMPFEEIELLPSFCTALIGTRGEITIETIEQREELPSYAESLQDYLSIWTSRLATLTKDPQSRLTADLSGGVDSRAVFSFLLTNGIFDTQETDRFRLVANSKMQEDFSAAAAIARDYDFILNGPPFESRMKADPREILHDWRANSLGVYMPVYFANAGSDPLTIHAHGAGGGASRKTQTSASIAGKLNNYKQKLDRRVFGEWATSVSESLVRLGRWRDEIDPLILHYREFRNRFHFGHRPQRRVMFTPLNSIMLDDLTNRPGVSSRQHFYDIMESLAPGLSDYPFDTEAKSPTVDEKNNLTTVSFSTRHTGKIYGREQSLLESEPRGSNAYRLWLNESKTILRNAEVKRLLGQEKTAICVATLRKANESKKILRANHEGMLALSLAHTLAFLLDVYP